MKMISQLNKKRGVLKSVSVLFVATTWMLASCSSDCPTPTSNPITVPVQADGSGGCVTLADLTCTCGGNSSDNQCRPNLNGLAFGATTTDNSAGTITMVLAKGHVFTPSGSCNPSVSCTELNITCA